MSEKLTRAQREKIIFDFLRGKENPAYTVEQTNHGKYVVKPRVLEIEEEEEVKEPEPEPEPKPEPKPSKQQLKRERRRQNRRAKQDAYRILEQLNRLLNANDQEADDESSDEEQQQYRAPTLIEQPNLNNNPGPISFRRKRLRF